MPLLILAECLVAGGHSDALGCFENLFLSHLQEPTV